MELLTELMQYIMNNQSELLALTVEHILLVIYGVVLAFIVGVPLAIVAVKIPRLAPVILSVANILQNVPSLAMLAILMLYFGLGNTAVIIGLFFYSLLPIIRNTYVGLQEVSGSLLDAGKGVGMNSFQLLTKVQIPLSLPFIVAGLRVAAVIAVGVASIAPYIGGGGLGKEIVSGIAQRSDIKILAGAIPAALLAILADYLLGFVEKYTKKRTA
ncbi:ABC transporter permease [Sporosarcina newyorkensis]|uniref:Osmoprotectant transport system permease protein n=1 Tax=Sporosarcina newyorkensis TaxID=759851 RepID=A0A1T4XT12_9BACL|nr:ABC transporter permease [Sporosarcina newyorkensis]SKA92680.1 osmoprotectant transport system permease protein [Sporosarcina newyorkensis]